MLWSGQVECRSDLRNMAEHGWNLLNHGRVFNRTYRLKLENLVANARRNKWAMLMLRLVAAAEGSRKLISSRSRQIPDRRICNVNHFAMLGTGFV